MLTPKTAAGDYVLGLRTSLVLSSLLAHMQSISIEPQCDGARRSWHSICWHPQYKKPSWRENRVRLEDWSAANVDTLIVIEMNSSTYMDTGRWKIKNKFKLTFLCRKLLNIREGAGFSLERVC